MPTNEPSGNDLTTHIGSCLYRERIAKEERNLRCVTDMVASKAIPERYRNVALPPCWDLGGKDGVYIVEDAGKLGRGVSVYRKYDPNKT